MHHIILTLDLTYLRCILPEWIDGTCKTTVVTSLAYEAMKSRKPINPKSVLGKIDKQQDLTGFPCKPR